MGALEITFLAVSKHVHWTGMLDIIVKNVRRVFKGIQLFYFFLALPLLQAEYI